MERAPLRYATLFLRMGIQRGCADNSMNPETPSGTPRVLLGHYPDYFPPAFSTGGLAAQLVLVSSSTLARVPRRVSVPAD